MASVLIVDDEPNIRRMIGALLGAEGYDVREASDGRAGVRAVEDDEPDVALIDLMMPGELDGLATLARIRERWTDLPVVMMSGRASLGDAVRATKLGAVNFLEKPLAPEAVLLALAAALELRQTRRARAARGAGAHRRHGGIERRDGAGAPRHRARGAERRAGADHR